MARAHVLRGGVSLLVLATAMLGPAQAESAFGPKSPFNWDWYFSATLGYVNPGKAAATSVDEDKFGRLPRALQHGLLFSAEYGQRFNPEFDWKVAARIVSVGERVVDTASADGLAYGKTKFGYELFDFEIGRRFAPSEQVALRMFVGLRGLHAADRIQEIALSIDTVSLAASANTWGVGPRAGIEVSHRLGMAPIFLTLGADASVLFSQVSRKSNVTTDGVMTDFESARLGTTIYTVGAKAGVTWFASPNTSLTIGYQLEYLKNIRQAASSLTADKVGGIDGRGSNLVHGPFGKLAVQFDGTSPVMPTSALPTPFAWTGFYVGTQAGFTYVEAAASNASFSVIPGLVFNGAGNMEGFLGGFFGGYNYQLGNLLLGVEGDWSWSRADGQGRIIGDLVARFQIESLASIRARVGFAYENALFYLTGGWAWSSIRGSLAQVGMELASQRHELSGAVFGGGLEYRVSGDWVARLEYLRHALGARRYELTIPASATYAADMKFNVDIIRAGLSKKL